MCCIISSLYFALLVDECCVTTWQKKGRDKVYTVGATQEQIRPEELIDHSWRNYIDSLMSSVSQVGTLEDDGGS